jgi:hypothetical protein
VSYAAASDVADYTPGLLPDGNFTTTTIPNKAAVERFLSAGCAMIETQLQAAGYGVPVPSNSRVYDQVVDLEALYAAGRAETVRMTSRVAATERTRGQFFNKLFQDGLGELLEMDLSRAGLSPISKAYAGGISVSDKESAEDDGDRVKPRFERDQFRHEGVDRPSGKDVDEESE